MTRRNLRDATFERDECGVGFVAHLRGEKSRALVQDALSLLLRLSHRGAVGADPDSGDGAGVLLQLPHRFFKREGQRLGIEMPRRRRYAVGQLFLPRDADARAAAEKILEAVVAEEGQRVLGWRDVPVDERHLGEQARATAPVMRQVYVARRRLVPAAFERKLFVIRKRVENRVREELHGFGEQFHVASLSAETIVYKGMMLPRQLQPFYADLADPDMVSALAVVHSRFSTNTAPTWDRAQPMRLLAHNGEINTLRGNVNWTRARRSLLKSAKLDGGLERLWPILVPGTSDSAHFDAMLELLVLAGRSLPHAMMMMIPEAYEHDPEIDDDRKAFYEYASALMEPWDGPAAMCFTDGALLGATLDRNGLRPARWCLTDDDRVILASEAGALEVPADRVVKRGRLQPGRMLLCDLEEGRLLEDAEVKRDIAQRFPYRRWLTQHHYTFERLPRAARPPPLDGAELLRQQRAFGYSDEDLHKILVPMAEAGAEPVGSMGNDTPLAILSDRAPSLFDYFHQLFAQVTNPPIDPLRESLVMSTSISIGPDGNSFEETPEHCHQIDLPGPILRNGELAKLAAVDEGVFEARRLSMLYAADSGAAGLERAVDALCDAAVAAVDDDVNILILSDRGADAAHVPVPALLATSAVHQRLVREGTRMLTGLVVETAEVREVHHVAALIGYGAAAVNPWLAMDTLRELADAGRLKDKDGPLDHKTAQRRYVEALRQGLKKVMSKMGISALQSYCGAQIFEAVGLAPDLVDAHFTGTPSRIGGLGLDGLHDEVVQRHARGFGTTDAPPEGVRVRALPIGGVYQFKHEGERHRWAPQTVQLLQQAARTGDAAAFAEFCRRADDEDRPMMLRGLLDLVPTTPVPLAEVEPASTIVKRFVTGAMSFGSISPEAHETLAVAMNRLSARSNSGEGGEEPARVMVDAAGDTKRSAIRQVASGRFGVTAEYLVHADDLQIKVAQGAKPGEGGQLPGAKVDERIARVRHTRAGTTLISPPPHHDIYSIEDLSQLIYDLQTVNPRARVSVKLVSAVGVGAVAAGVAKAGAGGVVISGFEGGTGAAPLSSLRHAGLPWELGVAEAQQALVDNRLRGRVRLQVDGGLRTPRDVVMAALLGAEEFGLATAALVAEGCVMQRRCHLNTCSVGVATQDAELRKKFVGKPEHVTSYFLQVAEGVRELLASLGARTLDDVVGQVSLLVPRPDLTLKKAQRVDLSALLARPTGGALRCAKPQQKDVAGQLDSSMITEAAAALAGGPPVVLERPVRNVDRAVGAGLAGEVARRFGDSGLPDSTMTVRLTGSAGQSLGAFLPRGVSIELFGEANDGVGKGLCGGRIAVRPPVGARFAPEDNVILGNVALYGATGGELFASGVVGERFAVRNSGAVSVVEGCGDHGCEYMTGGAVVVLGRTGRNFAAGMTGGIAYVLDVDGRLAARINAVDATDAPLDAFAGGDEEEHLKVLLELHVEHTGSPLGARLLSSWSEAKRRFVVVRPKGAVAGVQRPPIKVVA
ncbi:MAG: glutamate synthase large subunit [Deltaproteobacteria bacterium]|nr:glutamate synthase large subunit [Deltaproteobacteria bacterium]